jgi:SAM-dependent methyltransferase
VTGLDLSPRALSYAAARGERRLVRGNVGQLPFREASFDLVVSADVLYHRAVGDDEGALAELRRVCRPGGVVLLNLPAHAWLTADHDRAIHTARRYARRDLRRLAARTALDVVRLSYFNCLLFPLAAAVRLASRRGLARSDVRALPRPLDAALARLLEAEGRLLLRVPLPWGLSLFAVLRRPQPANASVAGARAFG